MKKVFLFIICISMITALCFVGPVACDGTTDSTAMSEVTLQQDHVLTWAPVPNAVSYSVRVEFDRYNGYEIPVESTTYAVKLYRAGDYRLSVRAKLADGHYTQYSAAVDYHVQQDVVTTPQGNIQLRGSGTKDDPLLVYDAQELASITTGTLTEKVEGSADTTTRQLYYKLMADIDLQGEEWQSIGGYTQPFEGQFDGNGHTISGIVQTKGNGSSYYCNGLFGYIRNAVIINLSVDNYRVDIGQLGYPINVGGIAGQAQNSTIANCRVSDAHITINSPVQSNTNLNQARAGLIVGQTQVGTLSYCQAEGDVNVTFAVAYAGGLVGLTTSSRDCIENCVAKAQLTTHGCGRQNGESKAISYAGTFIGYASNLSSLSHSVAIGTAKATAIDGTIASNIGTGMIGGGNCNTTTGQSYLIYGPCYFNADKLGLAVNDDYPTLADLADRYAIGGATVAQHRATTVFAFTDDQQADIATFDQLDWDNTWIMQDGAPALRQRLLHWYTVTYMAGEDTVGTEVVLEGATATLPFGYTPAQDYAFGGWQYDGAPITQDTVINAIITPKQA